MSLLIIRGDLQAHSGYAAAIRAYCGQLRHLFERVVGVDIHQGAGRPFEEFPHPIVNMAEARVLAEQSAFTLALSCTTPAEYVRLPNAVNVGLTFWEADRPPVDAVTRQPMLPALNCMDALWAPSTHTRDCFERAGVTVPIAVIPWPMSPAGPSAGLPEGLVYDLDHCFGSTPTFVRLGRLQKQRFRWTRWLRGRIVPHFQHAVLQQLQSAPAVIPEPGKRALVCIAQDAPRKALLLLLAEWLEFKRRPEAADWSLILKTAPLDPATEHFQFVVRFWEHVQALKRQLRVRRASVFLWTSDLGEADLPRLITNTFGSIACGLGEGFCAPAAAALLAGKPVIAPRHTAFADYIDPDYPYIFPTRATQLSFVNDPLGCYDPMTAWQVPEPLAIANALSRLVTDVQENMGEACALAQKTVADWCEPARIQRLLDEEIARLARGGFAGERVPLGDDAVVIHGAALQGADKYKG